MQIFLLFRRKHSIEKLTDETNFVFLFFEWLGIAWDYWENLDPKWNPQIPIQGNIFQSMWSL